MFPCTPRRGALAATIACVLVALAPAAARAADFGSTSWVADATFTNPAPGNGLFHDAVGPTYVYAEGGLTRVNDDTQGDFFLFSPRGSRTTTLSVNGTSWTCSGGNNVYVHTPGADWFPGGAGAQLDGYVYCYQMSDGKQVRVVYEDCLSVTPTGSWEGRPRWRASSAACGPATVTHTTDVVKGKPVWSFFAHASVPFDVTACLRGTLKQWRNGDVLGPGCSAE